MATMNNNILFSSNKQLSSSEYENTFVNHNAQQQQYSNLNLNQPHNATLETFVQSESKSIIDKHFETCKETDSTVKYENNMKLQPLNKSSKIDFKTFNPLSLQNGEEKEEAPKRWMYDSLQNTSNSSTLSLHIAAYENNSIDASSTTVTQEEAVLDRKKKNAATKPPLIQTSFELPRQQDNKEAMNPEVMQFKASQKLVNPNQNPSSNGSQLQSGVTPSTPTLKPAQAATSDGNVLSSKSGSTTASTTTVKTAVASPNPPLNNDALYEDCSTPVTLLPPPPSSSHTVSNDDTTVSQLSKLVSTSFDPDAPSRATKIRFYSTLLVLASIGITGLLANLYGSSGLSGVGVACLSLFAFQWYWIYGSALTRQKRAYFDEKNILDTYRTRDRQFGHLFQKEPDTPAPQPGDVDAAKKSRSEFAAAVEAHYGNMYENVLRMNREMDLMDKEKQQANADAEKSPTAAVDSKTTNQEYLFPDEIPGASPIDPKNVPTPSQIKKKKSSSSKNNSDKTKK